MSGCDVASRGLHSTLCQAVM